MLSSALILISHILRIKSAFTLLTCYINKTFFTQDNHLHFQCLGYFNSIQQITASLTDAPKPYTSRYFQKFPDVKDIGEDLNLPQYCDIIKQNLI